MARASTSSSNRSNGSPPAKSPPSPTPIPPPPDTIGFTPALGPLQDNGGPTPTHALVRGESYAIDSGKLQRELGWVPQETFESGIARTVDWYLDNQTWCGRVTDGSYRLERLGGA